MRVTKVENSIINYPNFQIKMAAPPTIRPRNAWFFVITDLAGRMEFSLGYKYADSSVTFFSAAGRSAEGLKPPWDPPVSCQYVVAQRSGVEKEFFKFLSAKGDNQHMPVKTLNNLFAGESDFSRRCTRMIIDSNKELLGLYMTLLPHSKGFSHHRPDLHNDLGMRLDGKGITVNSILEKGGAIEEFVEFKSMAEKAAFKVTQSRTDALTAIEDLRKCKKRKNAAEGGGSMSGKVTKGQAKLNAQMSEINEESGVERAFIDSYVGRCDVKIENISVSNKVCPRVNQYKVDGISNVMLTRFDPSKIHLTVCPADPKNFNKSKLSENKYIVISGNHSLTALKKLDAKGKMRQLVGMADGLVNCYIVNTEDPSVMCYGNIRSNDLDSKHVRKPQLQDLLFVFNTLRSQFKNGAEAVKVVVRYATLLVVGADEITGLKKLCSWQETSFGDLLKVVQMFETYETKDGVFKGNQARLLRGESLPLRTVLFKKLSKVSEQFFIENHQCVTNRELSLKDFVENYGASEIRRNLVESVLHLCKSQSLTELQAQYPRKFTEEKLDEYKGAVVFGPKKNRLGELLDEYCEAVLADEERFESAVQFKILDDSSVDEISGYNVVLINFKIDDADLVGKAVEELLEDENEKFKTLLVLFNDEVSQNTTLSYIRTLELPDGAIVSPIIFDHHGKQNNQMIENLRFGVFVSIVEVFHPPLKVYNGSQDSLKEVVYRICPPGGSIAYVSEDNLPIISLHCSDSKTRTVTYFATDESLKHFRKQLVAEKASVSDEVQRAGKEDLNVVEQASLLEHKTKKDVLKVDVGKSSVLEKSLEEEELNVVEHVTVSEHNSRGGVGKAAAVGESGIMGKSLEKEDMNAVERANVLEQKSEEMKDKMGSEAKRGDVYEFNERDMEFDRKLEESIQMSKDLLADIDKTECEYLALKRTSSTSNITYE